jgi:hypothetical protein
LRLNKNPLKRIISVLKPNYPSKIISVLQGEHSVANYKKYTRKQKKFIPVSFEEQIIPSTFEHALDHLIDHCVDTSVFDRGFQNDDTGAPAYNP